MFTFLRNLIPGRWLLYGLAALLATLAAWTAWNNWTAMKERVASAESDLAEVRKANQVNTNTISALEDARRRDAEALAGLRTRQTLIRSRLSNTLSKLERAEAQHEKVRDYLNQPIPPNLRRMYQSAPEADGGGADGQGTAQR